MDVFDRERHFLHFDVFKASHGGIHKSFRVNVVLQSAWSSCHFHTPLKKHNLRWEDTRVKLLRAKFTIVYKYSLWKCPRNDLIQNFKLIDLRLWNNTKGKSQKSQGSPSMKRRLRQDLIAYIHEPREKSSKVNQRACTHEGGKH